MPTTTAKRPQTLLPDARGFRSLNISALLEVYERNYRLLEQLLTDLKPPFDEAVSTTDDDPPLYLTVVERGRYTLSIRLSYEINGERDPDMWVTIYRDAKVAEATYYAKRPLWDADGEGDPAAYRYLTKQWDRNLTLHKWLGYLLEQGHGFGMAGRPREAVAAG